jgi:uncharacterized coiled-coil protein SlyX
MEELIKYFQSLETRLTAQEERLAAQSVLIATLEAKVEELQKRPAPQPEVVEKVVEKIVEKPVEVIKEVVVEKPVVVAAPAAAPVVEPEPVKEPVVAPEPIAAPEPEPVKEEPGASPQSNGESGLRLEGQTEEPAKVEPVVEEVASPKAAVYGKAVSDIRQAISLGDRFLYQRELFGQNAELMQRTLTELNGLGSFDEAMSYIAQFGWDTESNTYQQFIVTLHRRFG